ncbi:lysine 5,6-aminomutase reactivase subunit KamB [Thermoflavimicrobium dichotomicum]|uniref:Uncharacterized protein n=1 Tax=Thermoflavimicrobium dichotomicum TaxID=46223 RepID=A0A1I3K7U2_9BACL|nr:hypothetical protein [Thermoflavimicrobium dichotomicum]SFI68454.1 hypothetical protein SAMN05421852_101365 [Thermoflavimicrobium dichotomicum]
MRHFLQQIKGQQIDSVSIIGLAKNVGKTTVCNALIQELKDHCRLGVASIGVDGEERDVWSGRPKPAIEVPADAIVATAGALIDLHAGHWEVLGSTGVESILGETFIAKARRDTTIKLAGIPTLSGINRVIRDMKEAGVDITLVDGAYDRKTSASPFITVATILVVGASLGNSLSQVITKAEEVIQLFRLPRCEEEETRKWIQKAQMEACLYGQIEGDWEPLPVSSLLQADWKKICQMKKWQAIIVPGALTDRTLRQWIQLRWGLTLYLPSPTHAFVSLSSLRQFFRMGGKIEVLTPIRLLGVAINPVSPEGFSYSSSEMKQWLEPICSPLPVIDCMRENEPDG